MSTLAPSQVINPGEFGAQLLPDLYYVSWLGMSAPRIDCHVYVLRGPEGLLLIDCGTPWGYERIVRNMAHWGLDVADVRTILATHGHVDHVTGGYHFKRGGAEFLAHREATTVTETQWEACGIMDPGGAYRVDAVLAEGDQLVRCGYEITVYHTPGHSAGCLSFLLTINGARCLFSGDLIMNNGLPGWSGDPGYDPAALAHHAQRLAALDFEHLCHGHSAIRHDRGDLFRTALAKRQAGEWEIRTQEAARLRPRAARER